jgi:hypothetical protein
MVKIIFKPILNLFFGYACLSLISCERIQNPCLTPTLSTVKVGVKQMNTVTSILKDSLLPKANWYCLDIDSAAKWYHESVPSSSFQLVLSPNKDTVRYLVQTDADMPYTDTLFFHYSKEAKFYSTSCGYGYIYTLKDVWSTQNVIKEITVKDSFVNTNANVTNVQVIY